LGKTYAFFSRWTRLDELLAPYNARIFDKVAAAHSRTMMTIAAVAGVVVLCAAVAITIPLAAALAQRAWLVTRGTETQATVVSIVRDAPSGRRIPWAELSYTFETIGGERVSDALRRSSGEFAGLAQGRRLDLLYAAAWPQINLPRIGFNDTGFLIFATLLGFAFIVHIVLFLVRYRDWRRRTAVPPPRA
jgi:hypothetical protein